jgi:hypothetical protein
MSSPERWNSVTLGRKVLVVNQSMHSDLFPPDFPAELAVAVFATGREAAWPPRACRRRGLVVCREWIRGTRNGAVASARRGNSESADWTKRNARSAWQYH